MQRRTLLLAALAAPLAACKQQRADAGPPPPRQLTTDAVSEFCGMDVLEHPGPKGQIFVRDRKDPYWFATVRDTIAFTRLPDMPKDVAAIWVSDMARAQDWNRPDAWVAAGQASYVIGSRRRSGMQTDEAIPFGDAAAARRFAAVQGGRVVRLADIPSDYVFPQGDPS